MEQRMVIHINNLSSTNTPSLPTGRPSDDRWLYGERNCLRVSRPEERDLSSSRGGGNDFQQHDSGNEWDELLLAGLGAELEKRQKLCHHRVLHLIYTLQQLVL